MVGVCDDQPRFCHISHNNLQYGLDSKAETWDTLYHLMLSEVDSENGDSIAIRMHTLRNFYRGVWIATWYLLVLLVATVVIGLLLTCSDLPFELQSPGYTALSVSVVHLIPLTATGCLIFRYLAEKRNDDFINYLFFDYARKRIEEESNRF